MKLILFCLLTILLPNDLLHAYKYDIALTAIFRNEARFLQEWIEYYKLQGVEHFYLYNNRSDDNFDEVLAPYVASGVVDLFDWDIKPTSWSHWDHIQKSAYSHAVNLAEKKAKWLVIVDIDEFIVPIVGDEPIHKPLRKFLAAFENNSTIGGICIPWVFFGTSHVARLPEGKLLIETMILNGGAACGGDVPAIWSSGSYKSIVRPDFVKEVTSPHYCTMRKKRQNILVSFEQAQLNHYWTRDEDFLYNIKIARRCSWGQQSDEILQWANGMNHQTPYGDPILKFVPALQKRMLPFYL